MSRLQRLALAGRACCAHSAKGEPLETILGKPFLRFG